MQPKTYIAHTPGKLGNVFALFYCESGTDLYGWHMEARGSYFSAAFFMAEHYYSQRPQRLYRSVQDDVHGPWTIDYPPMRGRIRCPLPDSIIHDLEAMQSRFVEEWLFFKDDPHDERDIAAYNMLGLPVHEVNIRSRRLHKLSRSGPLWVYMTPGVDPNIVQLLHKYWRLSEKVPAA